MKRAGLALLLAVACTTSEHPVAAPTTTPPATVGPTSASPTTASPSVTASPSALPTTFGGTDVRWPRTAESAPAPPALGAVVTLRRTRASNGELLAAGLTLPRLGGAVTTVRVMTPCGRDVYIAARDIRTIAPGSGGALPKQPGDVLVVLDPGHGGAQLGALAPDGDREKDRNLQIALQVRTALAGRVGRVVMTRERDFEATIGFRAALVDALRADAALSVHLNSSPDGPRATPGTETFGSTADGVGRRFAGLVYESVRRYVQTLPGPWVGDRDAGAKYRVGSDGTDYYGLLRRAHRPFVIAESLYISSAHEASLVARDDVRAGLGNALADALVEFTESRGPGSGWTVPYHRPPDPPGTSGSQTCTDPS
jgi:N-acetylmuramoyl-L-alanine amidase